MRLKNPANSGRGDAHQCGDLTLRTAVGVELGDFAAIDDQGPPAADAPRTAAFPGDRALGDAASLCFAITARIAGTASLKMPQLSRYASV
jgi:hypothetical protein